MILPHGQHVFEKKLPVYNDGSDNYDHDHNDLPPLSGRLVFFSKKWALVIPAQHIGQNYGEKNVSEGMLNVEQLGHHIVENNMVALTTWEIWPGHAAILNAATGPVSLEAKHADCK